MIFHRTFLKFIIHSNIKIFIFFSQWRRRFQNNCYQPLNRRRSHQSGSSSRASELYSHRFYRRIPCYRFFRLYSLFVVSGWIFVVKEHRFTLPGDNDRYICGFRVPVSSLRGSKIILEVFGHGN